MASMTFENRRQIGRAKNAVLSFLERKLSVPKIYIDAEWDGKPVDVLAIDRDGAGDVHVVLLYERQSDLGERYLAEEMATIESLIDRLKMVPAQYKYVGSVEKAESLSTRPFGLSHDVVEHSFAPDGLGRVGFIAVRLSAEAIQAQIAFPPERFRAFVAKLANEYIHQHSPDWEMRA